MGHFECIDVYGGTCILLKYISNYTDLHDGTMLFNNIACILKSIRNFKSTNLYGGMYILLKYVWTYILLDGF